MTEFELKLEIPPGQLSRVAQAVRAEKVTQQRLQARYYDTADGRLARKGLVLRVRREGRQWVQTAKAPAAGPLERLEHNMVLTAHAATAPDVDLARHAGTAVGKRLRKALSRKSPGAAADLVCVYETNVQRVRREVAVGASVIEIALDRGRVRAGDSVQVLAELELELKQGRPEEAVQLARQWCAAHGLWLSSVSKSMKGQRLGTGGAFGPPVAARQPVFGADADGPEIVSAVLNCCLEQVVGNASELAGGSNDADHIHQLRVGIRRLRTALREVAVPTAPPEPACEAQLVAVFRELGRHRDQDHLARLVQPGIELAGGPAVTIGEDAGKVLPDVGAAVRSPAFQDALLALLALAQRPASADADADADALSPGRAIKALRKRLDRLHSRCTKDGAQFLTLEQTRQHRLRKRLKRLRYLAEFVAPLFPPRRTAAFIAALKPVQEALGLYNDELTALHSYRALARREPQAAFAVGWLSARRAPHALACQQALDKFAGVRPFWG